MIHYYVMMIPCYCRLRPATPEEELNRSWVAKPRKLDKFYFREQIDKFKDPDNDEHRVQEHLLSRRERRKKLKESKS